MIHPCTHNQFAVSSLQYPHNLVLYRDNGHVSWGHQNNRKVELNMLNICIFFSRAISLIVVFVVYQGRDDKIKNLKDFKLHLGMISRA